MPDGSLKQVKVLDSSGHKILDEAAVRIVKLAAPYTPFPEEMRREVDVLEIIRTSPAAGLFAEREGDPGVPGCPTRPAR